MAAFVNCFDRLLLYKFTTINERNDNVRQTIATNLQHTTYSCDNRRTAKSGVHIWNVQIRRKNLQFIFVNFASIMKSKRVSEISLQFFIIFSKQIIPFFCICSPSRWSCLLAREQVHDGMNEWIMNWWRQGVALHRKILLRKHTTLFLSHRI